MNLKGNDRVDQFIEDTLFLDEEKGRIILSLKAIIQKTSLNSQEEIKYGGIVYIVDGELITGIFVRKKHISLEFSFGVEMSDPKGLLEGSGKYRRHLKIMNDKDLLNKNVEFFVTQAFK